MIQGVAAVHCNNKKDLRLIFHKYTWNLICHVIIYLQRLDGSIRGELRKQAMDHFNAEYSQVSYKEVQNNTHRWVTKKF